MSKQIILARIRNRVDTLANWAEAKPVLLDGELGIVRDRPDLYKVGDGVSTWSLLPFRGFDGNIEQQEGPNIFPLPVCSHCSNIFQQRYVFLHPFR